jgi:pheromone shutdown protein TraB
MERDRGRERLLLIVAAAVAVGVHAGLAPDELEEWAPLGACFVAAAVVLAGAAAVVAVSRDYCARAAAVLALLFAGLVVGYVATRIVALPPLDPDREPLDALGVCTSALEALGLVAALRLFLASNPGGTA